jgi:hypothetical protein
LCDSKVAKFSSDSDLTDGSQWTHDLRHQDSTDFRLKRSEIVTTSWTITATLTLPGRRWPALGCSISGQPTVGCWAGSAACAGNRAFRTWWLRHRRSARRRWTRYSRRPRTARRGAGISSSPQADPLDNLGGAGIGVDCDHTCGVRAWRAACCVRRCGCGLRGASLYWDDRNGLPAPGLNPGQGRPGRASGQPLIR